VDNIRWGWRKRGGGREIGGDRKRWLRLIDRCDLAAYSAFGGIYWSFGPEMHREGRDEEADLHDRDKHHRHIAKSSHELPRF
jgi:hypothetical protein